MSQKIAWSFADKIVGTVQNISGAPCFMSVCNVPMLPADICA